MTKKRKRDGLSLPALFFSLFFCGVSGLYIYGVRDFSSLAFISKTASAEVERLSSADSSRR